jgi:hypothetical protein
MATSNNVGTRDSASRAKRERMLAMIAGALSALMFIWGFLRWLNLGDGQGEQRFSGYAFEMPTVPVIGFSLAAGLIAVLMLMDRRRDSKVSAVVPTALAATSFLLALAILLGKGAISPVEGSKVGIEIGLILALITALVQTAVLGMLLASRRDEDSDRVPADYDYRAGAQRV